MGYKKMKQNLGFADFALAKSMKHNRSYMQGGFFSIAHLIAHPKSVFGQV